MYKIVVFTHDLLARGLVRVSRFILGSQPDVETYCVEPGCNLEGMRNGVEQSTRCSSASDQEALVLAGPIHGMPFNTIIQLEKKCSFTYITDTNPPLLIEAVNRRLMDGSGESFGGPADTAGEGIVDSHVLLQVS